MGGDCGWRQGLPLNSPHFVVITTNAKSIAERLKASVGKMPAAIAAAVSPEKHIATLKYLGEQAMEAVSVSDQEREAIPKIIATVLGRKTKDGASFSMGASPALSVGADPIVEAEMKDLADWVTAFKEKDDRDRIKTGPDAGQFMSDAAIARRLFFAIKADPTPWLRTDSTGHGALNPEGLVSITGATGLTSQAVSRLLVAAIKIWSTYARDAFPSAVAGAIRNSLT